MAGSGDTWRITPEERAKHDKQFYQLKPMAGIITGEQARGFFLQSGLPPAVLGQIWALADLNADGKMDQLEFSIAMSLIGKRLSGQQVPPQLPASMRMEPLPGGFNSLPPMNMDVSAPVQPQYATMPRIGASSVSSVNSSNSGTMPGTQSGAVSGEWSVPQGTKLKYTQMFNMQDRTKKGFLTGMEARAVLTKSGLTHTVLAQVWNLSDVDQDGQLTCEEFCLCMYLVDQSKSGVVLPSVLPPDLVPPSQRRGRSGSIQGVAGMPGQMAAPTQQAMPVQSSPAIMQDGAAAQAALDQVTFEDKRKQNFDAGQAELERRQAQLREQRKQEEESRLQAERAEHDKREKIRLDQERKKQMEFEKQLQKQREIENEREEQRRKALEQRESARREMERQRQLEWERQRREQLTAEKNREMASLDELRSTVSKMNLDLESLENKKGEINVRIASSRQGVSEFTTAIDGMRAIRDEKMAKIREQQGHIETWTQSLCAFQAERHQLDRQLEQHNNSVGDAYKSVMHAHSNKQVAIERMKSELVTLHADTSRKAEEIEGHKAQLDEISARVPELEELVLKLQEDMSGKKGQWEEIKRAQNPGLTNGDSEQTVADGAPGPGFRKYQALYQFESRNHDELGLLPGDIVWVRPDQTGAEAGWLGGVIGSREGWFPEAYVQFEGDEFTSVDTAAPITRAESIVREDSGTLQTSDSSSFTAVQQHEQAVPTLEEMVQAQAQYTWRAKKENHLSFNPGDVITVHEQQEIWWAGELNDKVGWFPKSYVKLIGGSGVPRSGPVEDFGSAPTESPDQPEDSQDQAFDMSEQQQGEQSYGGEQFVSLYAYTSAEPSDLIFDAGEIIIVTQQDTDWWTGCIGSRQGMFPANYVKKVENTVQPCVTSPVGAGQSPGITSPVGAGAGSPGITSPTTPTNHTSRLSLPGKADKKPEIASVIAGYQATGPEQLSLTPGQLIQIRKRSQSGWWEGELQARGQKRKIGWFPANYVKVLGGTGSARNTPVDARLNSPYKGISPNPAESISRGQTPCPPQPTYAPAMEQVVALFPYAAQNTDELTFDKGSVINVIGKEDADWWKGEQNGVTGVFPANYVAPLGDLALTQEGALAESSQAWGHTGYDTSMYESGGYYSNPNAMCGTERNRQAAIQELIDTEENYMTDMSIVLQTFYQPMQDSGVLTEKELDTVFVNWNDLIICNTKLLKSLRVRKKMTGDDKLIHVIGDILCENLPHMTVYVRYCSCQLNAASLIQTKSESVAKFKDLMHQCQQDPRTKGMPISSFLLKPMQRITKYPLIIGNILKCTSTEHPDHQNLTEALARANELCSQVNEGVRERENSDRLEWIQEHIIADGLPEKIIFNSVTNCLGPRKVLHTGTLYKAKSGKELVGFLFNDFILLTQPARSIGNATSVFSLDTKNFDMTFKMYRTPIFLNEVNLKQIHENDVTEPTMFHVDHTNTRIYSLKAVSHTERDSWVKNIISASEHYRDTARKRQERANTLYGYNLSCNDGVTCGRILVVVMEGINLIPADLNGESALPSKRNSTRGKSDPYCEVSMGAQEHRTPVINNTLNPRWNHSMQFSIRDVHEDVLCITLYDRDIFTPNDFLGRTEVRIQDIFSETKVTKGPITKRLPLHEVESGEVILKLDLQLYENA